MFDEPTRVALLGLTLIGATLASGAAAFAVSVFAYNAVRRLLP